MSAAEVFDGTVATGPQPASVLLPGHDVPISTRTMVRRLLPQRQRRMVGAWCFVDHFGPVEVGDAGGMAIAPHPHSGLQTVTWLVDGAILHRDSLGSEQAIVPGQLNLMTSGHGIAHSEYSTDPAPPRMHGLQLWIALPEDARHGPARFAHHAALPSGPLGGWTVTVLVGEYDGLRSPAVVHSPLVGVQLVGRGAVELPLEPEFEYALLALDGAAHAADVTLGPGALLYLGEGRSSLTVDADDRTRLFLLGGEPFAEPLVMWWNFVGRSHEEIVRAREEWMTGERYGEQRFGLVDCADDPLPAPELPSVRLLPRDRHGTRLG